MRFGMKVWFYCVWGWTRQLPELGPFLALKCRCTMGCKSSPVRLQRLFKKLRLCWWQQPQLPKCALTALQYRRTCFYSMQKTISLTPICLTFKVQFTKCFLRSVWRNPRIQKQTCKSKVENLRRWRNRQRQTRAGSDKKSASRTGCSCV